MFQLKKYLQKQEKDKTERFPADRKVHHLRVIIILIFFIRVFFLFSYKAKLTKPILLMIPP